MIGLEGSIPWPATLPDGWNYRVAYLIPGWRRNQSPVSRRTGKFSGSETSEEDKKPHLAERSDTFPARNSDCRGIRWYLTGEEGIRNVDDENGKMAKGVSHRLASRRRHVSRMVI